jgi:hypothetical protein
MATIIVSSEFHSCTKLGNLLVEELLPSRAGRENFFNADMQEPAWIGAPSSQSLDKNYSRRCGTSASWLIEEHIIEKNVLLDLDFARAYR